MVSALPLNILRTSPTSFFFINLEKNLANSELQEFVTVYSHNIFSQKLPQTGKVAWFIKWEEWDKKEIRLNEILGKWVTPARWVLTQ